MTFWDFCSAHPVAGCIIGLLAIWVAGEVISDICRTIIVWRSK